jgi:large subunit ribosomal protein L30
MSGKLSITLKRSTICCPQTQCRTVLALGLRKREQTVVLPDNASVRGAAFKVRHLIEVKALTEE